MHGWLNSPPWTDGAKRRDSRNLAFAFYLMSELLELDLFAIIHLRPDGPPKRLPSPASRNRETGNVMKKRKWFL